MALNVGTLTAQILLDDSGFRQGVNNAGRSFQQLGQQAERSAQTQQQALSSSQRDLERYTQQLQRSQVQRQTSMAAEQRAAVQMTSAQQSYQRMQQSGVMTAQEMQRAEAGITTARAQQVAASQRVSEANRNIATSSAGIRESQTGIAQANREIARSADDAARSTRGIAQSFSEAGSNAVAFVGGKMKAGMAGVGLAAGTALASSFSLGLGRLVAIDDAKGKLTGLGMSTQETATVMKSALDSVKGTAYGLGDAATIAASAVAAGIKPGQDLTRYLALTADTASIAGSSLSEMGTIFNTVQTKGKAYTLQLNQLAQRGIPIYQWLADELGVTQQALSDMVAGGEIDAATYQKVIQEHIGGAAQKAGSTVRGSFENMKAAMGRFGAAILEPGFQKLPGLLASLTGAFDGLGESAKKMSTAIANTIFSDTAADTFRNLGAALSPIGPMLGEIVQAFAKAAGAIGFAAWSTFLGALQGVSSVLSLIGPAISAVTGFMKDNQTAVTALFTAWMALKLLPAVAGRLGGAVTSLTGSVTNGTGAVRGFGQQITNMQRAATLAGGSMNRFSGAIAVIGRNSPTIAAMGASYLRASGNASNFARLQGSVAAGITGVGGAARGLMGALGGPWGLAITGASLALMGWMRNQQQAKQRTAEHKAAVDELSESIDVNTGKLKKQGQEQVAAEYENKGTFERIEANKQLGISMDELVDAASGNEKALSKVNAALDDQVTKSLKSSDLWKAHGEAYEDAGVSLDLYTAALRGNGDAQDLVNEKLNAAGISQSSNDWNELAGNLDKTGTDAIQTGKDMGDLSGAVDEAKDKAMRLAEANGDVQVSFDGSRESAGAMSEAMTEFEESTDGAASKVDKLAKALDQLDDDALTEEEALQAWSDNLRDVVDAMNDGGAAAVDLNGKIDVTTEKGSKLQDTVRDQASAFNDMAASTYEAALAQGKTMPEALEATRLKLGEQRTAFVDSMTAITGNREQAEALADAYGLIPEQKIVNIDTNALDITSRFRVLADQINAIPADKPITTTAPGGQTVLGLMQELGVKVTTDNNKNIVVQSPLAPEVIGLLESLGIKVRTDNNKTILVTDGGTAQQTGDQIDAAANKYREAKINTVYVDPQGKKVSGVDMEGGAIPLKPEYADTLRPEGKAVGGPIEGPGGPTSDDVPIWASNGEFVMRSAAVEKYGPGFMHDVNAGKFAAGGEIGGASAGSAPASAGSATAGTMVTTNIPGLETSVADVAGSVEDVKTGQLDPAMTEMTGDVSTYGLTTQAQTDAVKAAWTGVGSLLQTQQSTVIDPAVQGMAANMQGQVSTVINPAVQSMGATVQGQVSTVVNPALAAMSAASSSTAQTVQADAGNIINPAMVSVGDTVNAVHTGTVDPVLGAMRGAVDNTALSFQTGTAAIGQHMDTIREATAAPVRFTIGTVFNNGLVGMWNSVSELLGTPGMQPYPIAFATGGPVQGPGGPTDDKIPAVLSNGEYVLNAQATKAAGVANLNRFNSANGSMGPEGMFSGGRMAFATGGLADKDSPAFKALQRGHAFAAKWSGKPYVLGGSLGSTDGTDCSGWMSSIADVILGGNGMQRQWATGSFPGGGGAQGDVGPQGFTRGLGAGMSIGVSVPHTAGTLGGVAGLPTANIESGGNAGGTTYGGAATGADDSQFPTQYHLPIIDGQFMSAGTGGGSIDLGGLVRQVTDPAWEKIMAAASGYQQGGTIGKLPLAVATKMKEAASAKIAKLVEESTKYTGAMGGGGDVERWRPMAIAALKRNGYAATDSEVNAMLAQINTESSGNPNAIQTVQDVNSGGNEAEGLMQIAKGTWPSVRDPALPDDRHDPWASMNASLRYLKQNGLDLESTWGQGHGYATGGTVAGSGSRDTVPAMLTPGEEVTKKSMAERYRPLLKAINAGQVEEHAEGGSAGFGGYTSEASDSMKPKNFYDWAALIAGGGFAAASIVDPYLGMAQSGQITLGDLAPTADTSANTIPGLTGELQKMVEAFNKKLEEQNQKLDEQQETLEQIRDKPNNVNVSTGTGPAAMMMTSQGL